MEGEQIFQLSLFVSSKLILYMIYWSCYVSRWFSKDYCKNVVLCTPSCTTVLKFPVEITNTLCLMLKKTSQMISLSQTWSQRKIFLLPHLDTSLTTPVLLNFVHIQYYQNMELLNKSQILHYSDGTILMSLHHDFSYTHNITFLSCSQLNLSKLSLFGHVRIHNNQCLMSNTTKDLD